MSWKRVRTCLEEICIWDLKKTRYIYIIWEMKLHVVICMVTSLTFLSVGLYIMFKSPLDCIFLQWYKCSVFVS